MRTLLASLVTTAALALPTESSQGWKPGIQWHRDLGAATRLAAERGAPLFVVFRCEA